MTWTSLIAFAPITTLQRVNDPAFNERPDRQLYDAGALTFAPGKTTADLLIDHDPTRCVGTIRSLSRFDDVDGPWLTCIAEVHDCPSWLKRHTPVSVAFKRVFTSDDVFGCRVVRRGILEEVSLLPPWSEPREPRARVLTFHPTEPKPAAREEIANTEIIYRPGSGVILGVR